jgi:hypothetical protein
MVDPCWYVLNLETAYKDVLNASRVFLVALLDYVPRVMFDPALLLSTMSDQLSCRDAIQSVPRMEEMVSRQASKPAPSPAPSQYYWNGVHYDPFDWLAKKDFLSNMLNPVARN